MAFFTGSAKNNALLILVRLLSCVGLKFVLKFKYEQKRKFMAIASKA
jgi:hypothetical protein